MSSMGAGTWVIIHTDGTSTTIKTEATGKTGFLNEEELTHPMEVSKDDEECLVFAYEDGTLRVFPLANAFEIIFKPEGIE